MKNKIHFSIIFFLLFILKSNAQNETNWQQIKSLTEDGRHQILADIKLDSKNNKWLLSRDGILKIDENEKVLFDFDTKKAPFKGTGSVNITLDNNDNLWIADYQNDILVFDGKSWTKFSIDNKNYQNKRFHGISVDSKQTVWISMIGVGIVKLKDGKFTYYNAENSNLTSNQIYRVYVLNGIPWFINNTEILLIKYDSVNSNFIEYAPLFSKEKSLYMDRMNVDDNNNLWIGSLSHSILIFNPNEEKFYSLLPFGEKAEITDPSFASDGAAYFINTYGQLMKYADRTWSDNLDGFITDFLNYSEVRYCAEVLVDKKDALYIPSDQGLLFNKSKKVITADIKKEASVLINEFTSKVYPNPSNNYFKIEITQNSEFFAEDIIVKIFSIDGRQIMQKTITHIEIENYSFDITSLTSGLYFVQINSENHTLVHKIIKL